MEQKNRPIKNLLLLFCDQLRADALGCYGNPIVQTPHIDALAADGVCFNHAYSQTPVCIPARYGLLDGKNPCRLGFWDNKNILPNLTTSLPDLLRVQRYFTCAVGKMHFTPVRAHYGFDRRYVAEEIQGHIDNDDYLPFLVENGWGHVYEPNGRRSAEYYVPQVSPLPPEMHSTAWIADQSCAFMRRNRTRPWFLYTSFIKPHPPFDPAQVYLDRYADAVMPEPLPGTPLTEADLTIPLQNGYKVDGEANLTPEKIDSLRRSYYACITQIDDQVGRIVAQLKELGQYENTLILFTSDHGELLGDHRAVGKRCYYDGSCHIPLIVSCPGRFTGGRRSDALATLEDVYATLLAASGAAVPDTTEGMNLLPVCMGEETCTRDHIFCGFGFEDQQKFAVLTAAEKYIYTVNGGMEHLLRSSDGESRNHAPDEPEQCHIYRDLLLDWLRRFDLLPADEEDLPSLPLCQEPPSPTFLNQFPHWPQTV